MATRRHRLRERRKTVGFTQERLAEQLGIDPTTVRRWESGESSPQPWLRPKLARCLSVSAEHLEELLGNEADYPEKQDSSLSSVPLQPSDENGNAKLNLTALAGVYFPVVIHGRPVLVVLGGNTEGPNWDVMSPSSRRLVLGFGAATAAASVFRIRDVTYPSHRPATPLTLPAPAEKSWATAIHDAVLNPHGCRTPGDHHLGRWHAGPPRVTHSDRLGHASVTILGLLRTRTVAPHLDWMRGGSQHSARRRRACHRSMPVRCVFRRRLDTDQGRQRHRGLDRSPTSGPGRRTSGRHAAGRCGHALPCRSAHARRELRRGHANRFAGRDPARKHTAR